MEKLERYHFHVKDPGQTVLVKWGENLKIGVETDACHSLQLIPTKEVLNIVKFSLCVTVNRQQNVLNVQWPQVVSRIQGRMYQQRE